MPAILNPLGRISESETRDVTPLPALAGATIAVLDNSKHNFRELMERVRPMIDEQYSGITWLYERKSGGFHPMSAEIQQRILDEADLVLTGIADCGCVSWSSHDAATFEQAGIPAVLFLTTPFKATAEATYRQMGFSDTRLVEVDHPLGGLPPTMVDERAAKIADTVAEVLKNN